MLDSSAKEKIGFSYIINKLDISSYYGMKLVNESINIEKKLFEINCQSLEKSYDNIENFIKIQKNIDLVKVKNYLSHIKNITSQIDTLEHSKVLDTVELYEIKFHMIMVSKIAKILNQHLDDNLKLLMTDEAIKVLNPIATITEDFYVYSEYSKKLLDIRKRKSKIESVFFKEDDHQKKEVLRKERSLIVIEESNEEFEVRKKLSNTIKSYVDTIKVNISKISELDLLIAKSNLAIDYKGIRPIFGKSINFVNARNPYFDSILKSSKASYQPISINLTKGTTIITGANMGGKSSSVRTVLLNTLLAHLGFYVFCDHAEVQLLDSVQFICSEGDNSLHGLSTFGVEVIRLNDIISKLNDNESHLIVVDEFARSTNPNEGMKFVKALANYSDNKNSITVLTTHFDNIPSKAMKHYQVRGFVDKEVVFTKNEFTKQISKYMDYSLIEVDYTKNVPKDALKIAKLLDLNADFESELISLYEEEANE